MKTNQIQVFKSTEKYVHIGNKFTGLILPKIPVFDISKSKILEWEGHVQFLGLKNPDTMRPHDKNQKVTTLLPGSVRLSENRNNLYIKHF